jgi:glycosyltransferase involved in cell wall biosynthesis
LLATHPIQYYVPWYRALAKEVDLEVFFSHRQSAEGQADAGYGRPFEWDVPLFDGYRHTFLRNVSAHPDVNTFRGCDTPEIADIIRERAFDAFIVHGWSTESYWQAMIACWRTRTPILVRGDSQLSTPRAWWWRAVKTPLFRAFISRFDGYLIVGSRAEEYLLHYGARRSRCFSAPHCVDNHFFESAAGRLATSRADLRRDFGVPADTTVFLLAGRLVDIKRVDVFIEAIALASQEVPSIAGLVVGGGPLRSELEALARARGARVTFAGFLNQTSMPRAYVAADCLVVSSTAETWALVVNEAMACGTPAIVSEGTGCAGDLVKPGVTGEIFRTGDAASLAASMVAIASNAEYRQRLSTGAHAHVAAFDVSVAAAGTARAVRAVSAAAHPPQAIRKAG